MAVGTIFEAQDVLDQGFKEVLVMDPVKDIDELAPLSSIQAKGEPISPFIVMLS